MVPLWDTEITKLLSVKYPLIQGGMSYVSDESLASAVSEAGGLGVIATGNSSGTWLREQIHKIRSKTNKPFGVNIMIGSNTVDELVNVICEEDVPVVITGAGNPTKYISRFKKRKIIFIPVVSTIDMAMRMEKNGADAVIAEGCEAGGHIGELTTLSLIPQVCDSIEIPVVAAGGIADGRSMGAMFMLGAAGVQVGTKFLVANECNIRHEYKEMIIKSKGVDTVVLENKKGHRIRMLKNKLTWQMMHASSQLGQGESAITISEALRSAAKAGNVEMGAVMAGQCVGLVNKEDSVKNIVDSICKEAEDLILNINMKLTNRKDDFIEESDNSSYMS